MPALRMLSTVAAAIALASCRDATASNQRVPIAPVTPDVANLESTLSNGVREFNLTAQVFTQQIATFPVQTAEVWGYNGSTPGPTARVSWSCSDPDS